MDRNAAAHRLRPLRPADPCSATCDLLSSITLRNPRWPSPAETLKKLGQFDTPTICNVIELFDVRPRTAGYMNSSIKAAFPEMPPMVGLCQHGRLSQQRLPPARATPTARWSSRSNCLPTLAGPAVVVFQDLDDPPVAATFGEVMCSTYKGFRLGRPDHLGRRPRPAAGQGDRLPGVHRLDHLLARLLPHPARGHAGARGRTGGQHGRPVARRRQRRDEHSRRHRGRQWPT